MFNYFLSILIIITSSVVSSACAHEYLSQNAFPQMNPMDLEQIVDKPFAWEVGESFRIHGKNLRGEMVGIATFKQPNPQFGSREIIAWFWSPESGFQVIASQTELISFYDKDILQIPFQFYILVINDLGIVAGSYLIDQPRKDGHLYNQCPWFWWSIEAGIHLSTPPEIYQLVEGINNIGHVLISEINKSAFVKDIYNEDYIRYVEYPSCEIMKKRMVLGKNWGRGVKKD